MPIDSDHCFCLIRLDLRGVIRKPKKPEPKLSNVLRTKEADEKVDQRIHNRFMALADNEDKLPDDADVSTIWDGIKAETHAVTAGERKARFARKPWVSELTLDLIDKRTNQHAKFMEKKNPTDADRTSVREARAAVRRSAKVDKSKYYEQIASDVQHAHDAGDQREVHSNIKKLKRGRTAAAATIVDADAKRWTDFYRDLLGTTRGDNDVPDSFRKQLSWRLCRERLDDHTQYAPDWNISTAPPTFEEFEASVNMCRNGKGVNGE